MKCAVKVRMNWEERHHPSCPGEVAVPHRKYCEANTVGTDGVVVQTGTKYLNNHPVRSLSMLRDFFDVGATLLSRRGNVLSPVSFATLMNALK
jgi:hypothetical protein